MKLYFNLEIKVTLKARGEPEFPLYSMTKYPDQKKQLTGEKSYYQGQRNIVYSWSHLQSRIERD